MKRGYMDCTACGLKGCRKLSPCQDASAEYIGTYADGEVASIVQTASELVDGGRAGKLSRLEEIVEYCRSRGHRKIGVAYCYGMEKEAGKLKVYLEKTAFEPVMVSCTVDGVSERRINMKKHKEIVSCNPIGQAHYLNGCSVDFVIVMGLCLGHDLLFQKTIRTDFTTFVVKDRVFGHNPILALNGGRLPEDVFLETLPGDSLLIKPEELKDRLKSPKSAENLKVVDLRSEEEYLAGHIEGALHCPLRELPSRHRELIPSKKHETVVYCYGGIQSVYAVMYLVLRGYANARSLSGGYSRYAQQE